MQHVKALDDDLRYRLEGIGGEPLTGSGFEDELPEPGFSEPSEEE